MPRKQLKGSSARGIHTVLLSGIRGMAAIHIPVYIYVEQRNMNGVNPRKTFTLEPKSMDGLPLRTVA